MHTIRPPAVSGLFYPEDPKVLATDVNTFLQAAHASELIPKALIVPHAGYIYSGAIAASAYAALKNVAPLIRRVVLLGPTHRLAVRGLALPGADAFATPLGTVQLDSAAAHAIAHLPQVVVSPQAHGQEHSLEVQLPFLQTLLTDFKLLPLAVGMASAEEVAEVLELLWGGDETLIVISSDLSHYLPYDTALRVDGATVQNILNLTQGVLHEQACGATPINGMMLAARHHHLSAHLLDLRNSGDTAGPRDGVVGYAAFAFTAAHNQETKLDAGRGKIMLDIARAAISRSLNVPKLADETAPWLAEYGACFVTLTQNNELRGCIGSLQAHCRLLDDIKNNAVSAALRDPRFQPLSAEELDRTRIEISLLSPPQEMIFNDEVDALKQLRPHIDGVIFQYGQYRSTFLPQVWEQLPEPQQFMAHLKHKAGLQVNFWSPEVKLSRYTVEKWKE